MIQSHWYLFVAGVVMLLFFLIYVYVCNHQIQIDESNLWKQIFEKIGLDPKSVTHDDSMWYYQGYPTCVAYGSFSNECSKHEHYCSGGNTYGDSISQASAVKKAVDSGGEHPHCPLVYPGAA